MDKTLAVVFNTDRVYVGLFERSIRGVKVLDINSTADPIDIQDIEGEVSQNAISELQEIVEDFGEFDRIALSFPSDFAMAAHIPGNANIPQGELIQMIIMEMRVLFPHAKIDNFVVNCYPVTPSKDGQEQLFITLIARDDVENCKNIFAKWDKPIEKVETIQLSAHQAVLYNYPEQMNGSIVVAGIQNNFIDFFAFQWHNIHYSNLVYFSDESEIPDIISKEIAIIKENHLDKIDSIYYYGADLVKDVNMACWEAAMMEGIESKRLNAFRMTYNGLNPRQQDYATKVFHLYAGVVGAAMPDNPNKVLF